LFAAPERVDQGTALAIAGIAPPHRFHEYPLHLFEISHASADVGKVCRREIP
jgi:hypothetical protein